MPRDQGASLLIGFEEALEVVAAAGMPEDEIDALRECAERAGDDDL